MMPLNNSGWTINLPDNPVARRVTRGFRFEDTGSVVVLADIEGPGCFMVVERDGFHARRLGFFLPGSHHGGRDFMAGSCGALTRR